MLFQVEFKAEESDKTIQRFVNDQVIPAINEMEQLALSTARLRLSLFGILNRDKLKSLEEKFRGANKKLLSLYYIYSNPDKLFADLKLDPQQDAETIRLLKEDYEESRAEVMQHFERGFRLLELIEHQLDRYHRSADQRLAVMLSILAITASLVSVIINVGA